MTGYDLLIFVHVLAACIWVGGAVLTVLLHEFAHNDRDWLIRLMDYEDKLAPRLFIPAALTTVIAGLLLVWDGIFSFQDGWVGAGLGLWILMFVIGMTFFAPAGKKMRVDIESHGADSEEVGNRLKTLRTISRMDLVLLISAVLLMTTKPF